MKAFSSRSSASIPAANSTQTNIIEIVTATATANESSGCFLPAPIVVVLTFSGEEMYDSAALDRSRLSMASPAKWMT